MPQSTNTVSTNQDIYVWTDATGDNLWDDAANWNDETTGTVATSYPGQSNTVVIPAASSTADFITGGGSSDTLYLTGELVLSSSYIVVTLLSIGSIDATLSGQTTTFGVLALEPFYSNNATYPIGVLYTGSINIIAGTLSVSDSAYLEASGPISIGTASGTVASPTDGGAYANRAGASGTLSVEASATFFTAEAVSVNTGLLEDDGGTVNLEGSVTVGTAATTPASSPYVNYAPGTLAVTQGGRIDVSPSGVTECEGILVADDAGSQLLVAGTLSAILGNTYSFTEISGTTSNFYGSASAANGGLIQLGGFVVNQPAITPSKTLEGAALVVDSVSTIEIGAAGGAVAGNITVDSGTTVTLNYTTSLIGSVINNGTILAVGSLNVFIYINVNGPLSGSGAVEVGENATLSLYAGSSGSVSSQQAIDFGVEANLYLRGTSESPDTVYGNIADFQTGDKIQLDQTVTGAKYSSTGENSGTLTLANGGITIATLLLVGQYGGDTFRVAQLSGGGSYVTVLPSSQPSLVSDDFNGDGQSDLLLQNTNGTIVIEMQSNLTITGGATLGNSGPTWHVVGSADFNGDGQPDILLQNDNGSVVDYLMNGATVAAGYDLTNPGSSWHVRGTGDFNGDGKADIVLQNDNGTIVVDDTNGTSVSGGATISDPGPGWTVEGVADFNGDGQPDILLQNTNGAIVDYLMNGTIVVGGYLLSSPGAGWSVVGTGNYNADNDADVVLHNDNGTDVVLYTNATSVIGSSAPTGDPGATWTGTVAGSDYNGDGLADLLLQNTDSTLAGFTLDGNAAITASAVLGMPGTGWTAIGNDPVQYIDGTGSNPTLAATVGADQFNLTSYTAGLHTIIGFDPAQDTVALSAASFPTFAAVQAHETTYNGGTAIGLTANAAVVIQGVTPNQLTASNFALH